jgi:hypothetical protein
MQPAFISGSAETRESVGDCVPRALAALAAEGQALMGLSADVITVAGLAHLAASLGRSCLLDDGATQIPACFNLAVVQDSISTGDWLATLGRGWQDAATKLQCPRSTQEKAEIIHSLKQVTNQRRHRSGIDPQFEALEDQLPLVMANMLRRRTISTSVDPEAVMRAIVDSMDQCVVLVNGASDPMKEWSHLTPGKQHKLAEMLSLSWQGKPISITGKGADIPGVVHVLWQTHLESTRRAILARRTSAMNRSVPILLFRQSGTAKRLPDVTAKPFTGWTKCFEDAYSYRLRSSTGESTILELDNPSRMIAEEFYSQFSAALAQTPAAMQDHLRWLPELVLRLYILVVVSSSMDKHTSAGSSSPQPDLKRNAMLKAVRLTRWLCQEHYCVVRANYEMGDTDSPGLATDSTDKDELAENILTKLRGNGPQAPRELQRSFHNLSAQDRDKAIAHLKSTGQVVETSDGRLEMAA